MQLNDVNASVGPYTLTTSLYHRGTNFLSSSLQFLDTETDRRTDRITDRYRTDHKHKDSRYIDGNG